MYVVRRMATMVMTLWMIATLTFFLMHLIPGDPLALLDLYLGGSPNNQTKWVNPKYDEHLTQGKTEQDENQRFEILHQAEDLFMQDLPVIPIYFASKNYLKSKNFEIPFVPNQEPNLRWAKKIS
ncbi:hypothetical protein QJ48_10035 [Paenibacillus sp. A3]|uniref:hypothetical protein n=1 Tax=Paenibacillus sp. A3 TaxID=1337054 RepID=UPI0006D56296|nr:hypothetical protein [Paenibacillus sp. A3]KPV59650.1 hypothetical protein QJ48_10035 [Paenibacillus sp. A3]